jgi:uncharacterized membrane protein
LEARRFYAGSFYVIEYQDKYYLKWFYNAKDESKTFRLSYVVENATTLHQDVAELYWKIIGNDWEVNQANIDAALTLPNGIPDNEIQAWAHGPNGTVSILIINCKLFAKFTNW